MRSKSDLRKYQQRGIEHITSMPGSALWADMGLGKSVMAATGVRTLRERFDAHRALVVAPFRVARSTWSNELEEWSHLQDMSITVAVGPELRGLAVDPRTDITTINIENLPWLVAHFREKGQRFKQPWPYDTLVLDESQLFRSKGVRWKAVNRIRPQVSRIIQLSGTPAPRGVINLWAQINLLDGGQRLGSNITAFRNRWFYPPGLGEHRDPYNWMPMPHAKDEIQEKIKDLVFSLSAEDYLDLPPVMYNTIALPMSNKVRISYLEMKKHAVAVLSNQLITGVNAGAVYNKLMQICNGAVYYDDKRSYVEVHQEKLNEFVALVKEQDAPVMAMYAYKHDEQRMFAALKKAKVNVRVLDTKQDEEDWNAGKLDVLLLHPAAGGHGLNLQHGGEIIIWFGLTANLEHYQQANARLIGGLRRVGKNVRIHHLTFEGTVEGRAMEIITARGAEQDQLTAAMRRGIFEEAA